jgi:hypothetical protein
MRTWIPAVLLAALAATGCGTTRATEFRVRVEGGGIGGGPGDLVIRSCKMDSAADLLEAGPSPDRSGKAITITTDFPGPGSTTSGVRMSQGGIAQVGYVYRTKWTTDRGWAEDDLDGLWFAVERPSLGSRGLQEFAVEVRNGRAWMRRLHRDPSGPRLGDPSGALDRISRPDAKRDLWEVRLLLLPWETAAE